MLTSMTSTLRGLYLGAATHCLQLQRRLDRLITAHWWWQLRQRFSERKLEKVLEAHGEDSIFARQALVQWQKIDFAYVFGRAAPSDVRKVVKAVAKSGEVPSSALWTLVINRDIRSTPHGVRVRRAWWAKPLKYAAQAISLMAFLDLATYTILIPGPVGLKLLILIGLAAYCSAAYMVWHLYTARPLTVIERYGDAIDLLASKLQSGSVVAGRGTWTAR